MNDRSLTADERVFVRRRMREELLVVAAVQLFIPLVLFIGTLTTWTFFGLVSSPALIAAAVFVLYEAFWIVRAARRWLRLRRDLHGDMAHLRKGTVRWVRVEYVVDVDGRRLPFANAQGSRLPGRTIAAFLPHSGYVLTASEVLEDGGSERKQLLQQALAGVFHFSAEAFADNREGRLSGEQRRHLLSRVGAWLTVTLGWLLLCWFVSGIVGMVGLAFALPMFVFAARQLREVIAPKISQLEGPIRVSTAPWGRGGSKFYSFDIGDRSFGVPYRATVAFDPAASYRVSFCPRIRRIISIEIL